MWRSIDPDAVLQGQLAVLLGTETPTKIPRLYLSMTTAQIPPLSTGFQISQIADPHLVRTRQAHFQAAIGNSAEKSFHPAPPLAAPASLSLQAQQPHQPFHSLAADPY